MAQLDNRLQPGHTTLIQDMLRLVADNPDLDFVVPAVLQQARLLTEADSAFYMVFDEPHVVYTDGISEMRLPPDETLEMLAGELDQELCWLDTLPQELKDDYHGWVLESMRQHTSVTALFGLLFKGTIDLEDDKTRLLMSLLDLLNIVTQTAKAEAHHQKLTRNQNEFVRIVSHDLRSPLTSIKGFASMIEAAADLDEKQAHFVGKILSGVSQMTRLVDNIQDAGRYDPETGFYEMERHPTDLLDMVQHIVSNHLVPAEKEALTIKVDVDEDIPILNVDHNMLERSITNLVDNAIKYTPNGGTIEVGVKRDGEDLVITVADNGYGISAEHLKNLFQRHYRIRRQEHKRVKGSGLGLFIVRSVARHHNGDAFVESIEGEGTTFGIRIPLMGENLLGGGH